MIRMLEMKNCIYCQGFLNNKLNVILLYIEEGDSVLLRVITVDIVDIKYWVAFDLYH